MIIRIEKSLSAGGKSIITAFPGRCSADYDQYISRGSRDVYLLKEVVFAGSSVSASGEHTRIEILGTEAAISSEFSSGKDFSQLT